jgi:ABC-2 type transport system ATP-binding protein
VSASSVVFEGVSRWYGDTVALSDVSFTLGPGITGLLGHNGAGKSTVMKLCAGFTPPSSGTVRVLGSDLSRDPEAYRRIGIAHERDALWAFLTARELVTLCARLRGVADPGAAAERALGDVGLSDAADRRLDGFSHGMRQRVKLAQALAHAPDVLLLDEPLDGLDPAQRRSIIDLVVRLGGRGRTILVSSHVLHEVERMAPRVLVLVNGHLVASGATADIRELIAERPRRVRLVAEPGGRDLARELVGAGLVESVRFDDGALVVESANVERLGRALPALAREVGARLRRVEPVGEDLESVYSYLHERARGVAR